MPIRRTRSIVFATMGTRTGDGASSEFDVSEYAEGTILVNIKTVGGTTPSLDIDFDVRSEESDTDAWHKLQDIGTYSAAGKQDAVKVDKFGSLVRISWAITGTNPSFEFSVIGVFKD